jgi:hypothetical protein
VTELIKTICFYAIKPTDTSKSIFLASLGLKEKLVINRRMASSGVLRCVALVRTEVSEAISASIIRVTRIGELGTLADSCHPDDGGAKFLRNVSSYKSHTA